MRRKWRAFIYARDGFRCAYCGGVFAEDQLSIDHFWPTKHGGSDDPANMVTACRACNALKDALPPLFFRAHRAALAAAMQAEAAMCVAVHRDESNNALSENRR
jgi:5-methylcytosine-specific restriction endonuclease McrA